MLIREDLYKYSLRRLLSDGVIHSSDRILVLCGGTYDKEVLASLGFSSVTISNLDERMTGSEYAPYQWSFQDAENLTFEDSAFDFCIVHSGLHHCYSPHRAILEMYRVARRGVILFEPCDNWLTRLGVRLGLGQDYEHAAVADNQLRWGGVKNSSIPNYVYRFTEREIVKTINCFAPYAPHRFGFIYAFRIPWLRLRMRRNKLFLVMMTAALPLIYLIGLILPKQSNNFAALVLKPELQKELFPWLRLSDLNSIAVNEKWFATSYKRVGRPRERVC